jgi:choline-sulfatase
VADAGRAVRAGRLRHGGGGQQLPARPHFGFAQGFASYEDTFDAGTASLMPFRGARPRVKAPSDRRADATTDLALRWLAARDPGKPFFLWVHYFDPHHPYWPPPPWNTRFREEGGDGRADAIAAYDGEIAFADEHLGRLLKALDPTRTIVAVTADHGEGLWQHGHKAHGIHLYEEAVRVPLLFRWGGHVAAGMKVPGPVELTDLAPTLLDLAGVPWTGDPPQGQSLGPALRGQRGVAGWDERRPVFLQRRSYEMKVVRDGNFVITGSKLGLRQGRFKYIEAPEEKTRELFDLVADPGETDNLVVKMAPDADRLAALLERWRAHHDRGATARQDRSAETEEALRALGYVQ